MYILLRNVHTPRDLYLESLKTPIHSINLGENVPIHR